MAKAGIDRSMVTGALLEFFATPGFDLQLERAPDVSGSPGTYVVLLPLPDGTFYYFDPLPNDGAEYWYRFTQTAPGYLNGAYCPAVKAAPQAYFVADLPRTPGVLSAIQRSFANPTTADVIVQHVQDTGHLATTMQESGGVTVNRLLAKPLAADPNTLDSVVDGISYGKVVVTGLTSGQVDLALSGVIGKHGGNLVRSGSDTTPIVTIIQNVANSGHLGSGMQESGGVAVNRLLAKPLAGDPNTADSIAAGVVRIVTTLNEATGAGRAYAGLDTTNRALGIAVDGRFYGDAWIEAIKTIKLGTPGTPSPLTISVRFAGADFEPCMGATTKWELVDVSTGGSTWSYWRLNDATSAVYEMHVRLHVPVGAKIAHFRCRWYGDDAPAGKTLKAFLARIPDTAVGAQVGSNILGSSAGAWHTTTDDGTAMPHTIAAGYVYVLVIQGQASVANEMRVLWAELDLEIYDIYQLIALGS